jgi:hypothetical protein
MNLRQLRVILRHLPDESAFRRQMRKLRREAGIKSDMKVEDLPADAYSQTEWLLIALHDQLTHLTYLFSRANFKEAPQPNFLPRPGGETKRRRTLNAWFGAAAAATTAA